MQQPKYDPEHALVLCRQHNYRPGLVLLYDKKRLHREVLAVYMEAQDYDGLIAACVQYGKCMHAVYCYLLWVLSLCTVYCSTLDIVHCPDRLLAVLLPNVLLPGDTSAGGAAACAVTWVLLDL